MIKGDTAKWIFTFFLTILTVIWAGVLLFLVRNAMLYHEGADIVASAGVSVLLGSLITWTGQTVQYWFRKKTPS